MYIYIFIFGNKTWLLLHLSNLRCYQSHMLDDLHSVLFSHSVVSNSLRPHGLQHARIPYPSQHLELVQIHVHWVSDAIQLSHPLLSFNLSQQQGSFPMSLFFALGGQNIWASASSSVFPMNIHNWFPLGWTSWISLQSKELSRVFSNTTVQKY